MKSKAMTLALSAALVLALTVLVFLSTRSANASTSQNVAYGIEWYTIDAGGDMSSKGGGFTLGGTIGQPDAGAHAGSVHSVVGGFWGGLQSAASNSMRLFMPLLRKSP